GAPAVSFVIGHRGEERVPLLLATLASLKAQDGCGAEIVVVEQATRPILQERLPEGVRWIHQVPLVPDMPYSRSWAFNRGAEEARGRVVVLHDNDILAPAGYAAEIVRLAVEGFEAMRLMRFLFCLAQEATAEILRSPGSATRLLRNSSPEAIRQNCHGGTIAVTREAYFRIGGHDEGFVGWGGEDNEFFDRCRLLRFHPWGYLPFVHLWHCPQPEKSRPIGAQGRLREVMVVPREERVRKLVGAGRSW
ncbi:MAG: galactosyltransferase-related protein, partial [Gammaproteobacteria bacterium]|nr:galactosyltransferase-related protein [Gammaproteobacteria bacterium]